MRLHDRGRLSIFSQFFELCAMMFCLSSHSEVKGCALKRLLGLTELHDCVCFSV